MVKLLAERCKCGWRWESFHICLDLPEHVMKRVEDGTHQEKKKRGPQRDARSDAYRGTDAWRSNVSEGMREHHENRRRLLRDRDSKIVWRYSEDQRSIRELAEEFEIDRETIRGVLYRARDAGELVIRSTTRRTTKV